MSEHSTLHGTAARALIVISSLWTAVLQLFASNSLAYRAAGDSWMIDAINVAVLLIAGLALADVVWHDLMRKGLIWPSFPNRSRHQICVWVYMALASAFGIRAFIAAGDPVASLQVGAYYVLLAAGITMEAIALSKEERSQCQPTSDSA